ncbi:MAG: hypothetical protein JRI25_12510 [Deltaproteobacteria bacterium]|nr:hypothetical protein [Deltaproteobacteria bacterium]MBW2255403.1 hypothetical protein [Deltaproteobacteria bacterium]
MEYVRIPPGVQLPPTPRLGDAVYRCSSSSAALETERNLIVPGVANIYRGSGPPPSRFIEVRGTLRAAGLPVPETHRVTKDREHLRRLVQTVGGFPVILQAGTRFFGRGVMPLDSNAALFSVVDFMWAIGDRPRLRRGDTWHVQRRVFVIGDRVVGAVESTIWSRTVRVSRAGRDDGMAVFAAKKLGLSFAEIELTFDPEEGPHVADAHIPTELPEIRGAQLAKVLVRFLCDAGGR